VWKVGSEVRRVDNYLQEELFDPTLLAMPTTKDKRRATSHPSNSTSTTSPAIPPIAKPAPRLTAIDSRPITLDIPEAPPVRIVKSKRRKRHIAAYRQSGEIVISVPFRTTRAEISALVPDLVARVMQGEEKNRKSERELEVRAETLLATYLPEFTQRPASISWRTMNERWGSCTTVDRTIRISERLRTAPDYVIDHVLFHELIHLEIPGHGEDFETLLHRHPDFIRAEAFLEGYESGAQGL
jgi:predicted metal-dependent hydrolase